jgi:hypothetical protein
VWKEREVEIQIEDTDAFGKMTKDWDAAAAQMPLMKAEDYGDAQ